MGFFDKYNLVEISKRKAAKPKVKTTIQQKFIDGINRQINFIKIAKKYTDFTEGRDAIYKEPDVKQGAVWFDKQDDTFGTFFKIGTSKISLVNGLSGKKLFVNEKSPFTNLTELENFYIDLIVAVNAGEFDTILNDFESKQKPRGRKSKDNTSVIETAVVSDIPKGKQEPKTDKLSIKDETKPAAKQPATK